tara:strand:+ start:1046 stop:2344 length:1299 start_codon:yes stop_codon:yes gene_type:complete
MNQKQRQDISNQKTCSKGVEVLCIGTELLLGNILNSNAKWLAEELSALGLPHYRQTVVGDNSNRLREAILEASQRSRILITTGGLGPTPDDLTTETIGECFQTHLEQNNNVWLDIQEKLKFKSKTPSKSNQKQALIPIGADIIPNRYGTAPGIIWTPIHNFTIITLPGVPTEMKQMWAKSVAPWLKANLKVDSSFFSKVLRFTGVTESSLAEKLEDILAKENPTVAPYASLGEVKIRITAKSTTDSDAKELIKPIEKEILNRTGNEFYGCDEDDLASVVIEILRKRGETLAIAESCTGGGLGAAITSISGSSDVFLGGVIAYQNSIKKEFLDVSEKLIEQHGAVSTEVVEAMAIGIQKKFNSDWSIAVSGLAGPNGGSLLKPIGLVQFCVRGPLGNESGPEIFSSKAGRISIQKLSVLKALDKLRLFILKKS